MRPIKLQDISLTCYVCKKSHCDEMYSIQPCGNVHHICGDCIVNYPKMKNAFWGFNKNKICKLVKQIREDKGLVNIPPHSK
jgi:hypothetical protein